MVSGVFCDCAGRHLRDLHQRGDQRAEPEAFNDDGSEVGDASVGDVADAAQKKEQVRLDVRESLPNLVPFEVLLSCCQHTQTPS